MLTAIDINFPLAPATGRLAMGARAYFGVRNTDGRSALASRSAP